MFHTAEPQGKLCQNVGCMSAASSGFDYCGLGCKPGGARHRGVKAQGDAGFAQRHSAPAAGQAVAAAGTSTDIARKVYSHIMVFICPLSNSALRAV